MLPHRATICAAALVLLAACGDEQTPNTPEPTNGAGKGDQIGDKGAEAADQLLRERLDEAQVVPLDLGDVLQDDHPKVRLGQALFFDRVISGNQDIACATCHHPEFGTSDALALPIGVGGAGLGDERQLGEGRGFIPRNSPEIFNRGATAWTTMFWDSRVAEGQGNFYSPAGDALPEGLDSVLAVQAMFPPTSAEEMRGGPSENSVADLEPLGEIWAALTSRVVALPGYRELLDDAYPDVELEMIGFQHLANAIAAYEVSAFTRADTPFDQYVAGDDDALTGAEKRGALLFFGDANCASCHNGELLSDQLTHVIATPQLGPGKGETAPVDEGRMLETGRDEDKYAFRTPPLRNVELTGPYMHAGSYASLREAVVHHLDPGAAVSAYDPTQLDPAVAETMVMDPEFVEDCLGRVSPLLAPERPISDAEVDDLVAFLQALTDPSARDMRDVIPSSVPSGLPIDGGGAEGAY